MLNELPAFRIVDALDILVVAVIIYWVLLFIRGTRAVQMLFGLLLVMGLFILSKRLGMVTFQWIVGNFLGGLIIVLVVIFQNEIRRGLAKVGQARIFGASFAVPSPAVQDVLARAAMRLSSDREGAIILIERGTGLQEHVEHGRELDALVSVELLQSIFNPLSPIHDGAVVVRGDRVAAAGVILPIPAESGATRGMGTRHRAAWGAGTETDAVAVVVSEETGNVTVFAGDRAHRPSSEDALREILDDLLRPAKRESS